MTAAIRVRHHGAQGPTVFVLHGGPGAPGSAAGLARGLAERGFRVIEPLQRGSGPTPLTVARHVEDLRAVVADGSPERPATLVGWSWGAMLALCFAAAHPGRARLLVLVGCGTWDEAARAELRRRRAARLTPARRDELAELERLLESAPADARDGVLARMGALLSEGDDTADAHVEVDAQAHVETWSDLVRLQREGVYPSAFSGIDARVVMLHGTEDAHPGELVHASLAPWIPALDYVPLEDCGHEPWRERARRERFFTTLGAVLRQPA